MEATGGAAGEQLTLAGLPEPVLGGRGRSAARRRTPEGLEPAASLPVARLCIDLPPAHLDRVFEYLVPEQLSAAAVPGTRVKVRFGRQDVDGYVLARTPDAEHDGALQPLRRVVSAEPVLSDAVARLARAVADRYAGTLADVLRLAIPPRHARVESEPAPPGGPATGLPSGPETPSPVHGRLSGEAWLPYRGGPAFLQHLAAGSAPRAVWTALPGPVGARWPDAVAQAVQACLVSGRGALVVVPDARDVAQVCEALDRAEVPACTPDAPGGYVRLAAEDGAAPRYRAFLAALRGRARVVVGTRAAAFAPVADLGLVVCWDDGDDLHAEPRAPYPHVREVVRLRAELEDAAVLLAAHARSVESQALVETGWAREVSADRAVLRARTPRVRALTSVELAREGAAASARLPGEAWRAIREHLAHGPVLVQVPRAGYVPAVACGRCRALARCTACHGPLSLTSADGVPQCGWCGRLATEWRCAECGAGALRSVRVGSERTAEELGRAFPGVPVRSSGARSATGVLASVPATPALVVATTGAEPVCDAGYAAGVLLDAAVASASTSLRGAEDALRRWLAAAALVRPSTDGGVVLLVGDGAPRPTQALVRWDPAGLAARELAERHELALPPSVRVVAVTGGREAVRAVLARLELPPGADVLGPVPVDEGSGVVRSGVASGRGRAAAAPAQGSFEPEVRALVRAPVAAGDALVRTVAASVAVRSARREGGTVRVQVDPSEML
ncbi:primosomal protein N' [Cellulomonas cellasea]|uniref:Probable replication restart protein PriA n=1 Tax=Cellulomonas cellasea TaxID=43670 RepID=A0A4Y3L1D6_9CELL|nr:primosomal protein N' [Cellulomonas cellasea]GEA88778.1 putative primosomal protein N' [Cellulomonas cellasea]